MRKLTLIGLGTLAFAVANASAQWVTYVNETSTRLVAASSLLVNDNLEKDFAWGDFDQDGDQDVVCMRKFPGSIQGGFRDILFMNEGGILVDRTQEYGSAADAAGSLGMLDACNDRDVKAVDVNNDGWLDLVTATTMSDQVSTMLGQPRVYMNMKTDSLGNWRGFRFEDSRIPQLFAISGAVSNPRFCDAAIADFTGDGYVDIFYTDYDTPETSGTICIDLNADGDTADAGECQQSPGETGTNDFNNKFLVNQGASAPGFFTDSTTTRMTAAQLDSAFGNAALAADLNGDGKMDVVRVNTLTGGQNVATIYSKADGLGTSFNGPDQAVAGAPYNIDKADLNGDGRMDLVVVDDGQDKVLINTGNGADGFADFTAYTIADSLSEFGNTTRVADLDNDGKSDVIICDVDADLGPFCPSSGRITKIYRNTGVVGTGLLDNLGNIIPQSSLDSVYDMATVDIDGNGWLDLVVGRCGGIEVYMNRPPINIAFSYPSGRPTSISPDATNSFPVNVAIQGGGSVVAGSAKLHVSLNNGAFTAYDMTQTGALSYLATFPSVNCGDSVRYYLAANLSNGGLNTDPSAAPAASYSVPVQTGQTTIIAQSFEAGAGGFTTATDASVTFGGWVVGTPVGTANGGAQASPSSDATAGSGVACFQTGIGTAGGTAASQDLDGGPVTLTSPAMDLTGLPAAMMSTAVWFYCDDITTTPTQADVMRIEVSNDGTNWILMEQIATNQQWAVKTYSLGSFVALNATVRVRFVVTDNPNNSVTEAAIDEFQVVAVECVQAPACPSDLNGDGTTNAADLSTLLNSWGTAKADLNGDGTTNAADLSSLLNGWGPCQ